MRSDRAPTPRIQLHVLKPFVFTAWPNEEARLANRGAQERKFKPGVHELDATDPMLSHPWIARDFADGAIERPDQTQARLAKAETLAKAFLVDKASANAAAEAALMRSVKGQGAQAKVDEEAFKREINTPVNELRSQALGVAGADVVKPVSELQHGFTQPTGPAGPLRPGI